MKNILYQESIVEIKHLFRMMRNTLLALFVFAGTAFATESYSQTMKVTVVADNVSTGKVISEIEKQTDYLFVYNVNEVNLKRNVKVNAQNKSVAEVLNKVFEGTDIYYAMEGKNIMLMSKAKDGEAAQQANKVTGIVKDNAGIPIVGATIMEKGSTNGTVSDLDGNFSLQMNSQGTILISYIGYITQEIKVDKNDKLIITLEEDTETLDEVVVVGYGAIQKRSVSTAISTVKGGKISEMPTSNISQSLVGMSSGITLQQISGEPGAAPAIRVRGAGSINSGNDPLFVIDGYPTTDAELFNNINPADIADIQILKDAASSAIYGSKAGNGVIIVTT